MRSPCMQVDLGSTLGCKHVEKQSFANRWLSDVFAKFSGNGSIHGDRKSTFLRNLNNGHSGFFSRS